MKLPAKPHRLIGLSLICIGLAACAPSDEALSQLAQQGKTENQAPVQASSTVVIQASAEHVWTILVNFRQWPQWNHDVEKMDAATDVRVGTPFVWTSGGTTISSRIAMLDPGQAVAWTGHASLAKAIHVITLQPVDASHTRVTSTESMDGPLLSVFYSSAELKESEDRLVQSLKTAAEHP
jgi:uncharacterized membrane protein